MNAFRAFDAPGAARLLDLRSRRKVQQVNLDTWEVHGYTLYPGGICTIRARTIRIHQIGKIAISEQDVNLTGSTCWVYVTSPRPAFVSSLVLTAAVEPLSDAGALNVPLYCFQLDVPTGTYRLADSCRFDIHIDAPSR